MLVLERFTPIAEAINRPSSPVSETNNAQLKTIDGKAATPFFLLASTT